MVNVKLIVKIVLYSCWSVPDNVRLEQYGWLFW